MQCKQHRREEGFDKYKALGLHPHTANKLIAGWVWWILLVIPALSSLRLVAMN